MHLTVLLIKICVIMKKEEKKQKKKDNQYKL